MPDCKEMVTTLFRETAKALSILQKAQQKAEEMYMSDHSINTPATIAPGDQHDAQASCKSPSPEEVPSGL